MNETDLKKQNEMLKELLKQTLYAMCDYRSQKGYCANCNTAFLCIAKKVIPKVEKALNIKKEIKSGR